jgi:hypothetical protein
MACHGGRVTFVVPGSIVTATLPEPTSSEHPRPLSADEARAARLAARNDYWALQGTTVLAAVLLIYLGLNAGGFPRSTTGMVAAVVAVLLALRALLAPRTVRRPGALGMAGAGALLALAAWQLLSVGWSHSAWRAIAEFDRTALYLVVFLTYATLPRRRLQPLILSVGGAIVALALIGLAARLRPDLFTGAPGLSLHRLSYPLTYWNAMGVMCACALVVCLHAAADSSVPRAARIAGATAFPAVAATLYLTLSRGGIGAAVVGLVLYAVLGRPRGLVLAVAAVAVPTYLLVTSAYDAEALVSDTPLSAVALAEGRGLVPTVVLCCLAAGGLRALMTKLDAPLLRLPTPDLTRGRRAAVWGGAALLVAVVAVAAGGPSLAHRAYDDFVNDNPASTLRADQRARLTQTFNGGRIKTWELALDASKDHRWRGTGAGTFDLQWRRYRTGPDLVSQGHSLYVETLSELGIVGLAAVSVWLLALLTAAVARWRRRPAAAAVLAVIVAWALHAAVDWDWEIPAITLAPLILGAAATAVPARRSNGRRRLTPPLVGFAALLLGALPAVNALAETRIDQALRAYERGQCSTATARAYQAQSLLSMRPEPTAVLALCAAQAGRAGEAIGLSHETVAADPNDWEWNYLDALVVGASGGDPRPALMAARERDPRGVAPNGMLTVLGEAPRGRWAGRSRGAFIWIHNRAYRAIGG